VRSNRWTRKPSRTWRIEEAIAEIIVKMGLKRLPLLPARHTMHLMAKAAVTVYEAALANQRREEDR
jgi:hypothetical protein